MSEAIGGSNVADCPHACTSKPCGSLAKCVPQLDNFECVCSRFNKQCNQQLINSQVNASAVSPSASQIEKPTLLAHANVEVSTVKSGDDDATGASISSIAASESVPQIIPGPPSMINKIEVSVMVPAIDTVEHDFVPHDDIAADKSIAAAHTMKSTTSNKKHSLLKHKSKYAKRRNGVCFSGDESYFHYHDEETKRHIINYNVDLNLRMKTYSANGVILWAGPHTGHGDGDYLMLGIENG